MFILHKQLKVLNAPASKVARLNASAFNIQLALPGYPPQMAGCYLVALAGGAKVLVLVALHLSESQKSVFYVPQQGEVAVEEAERVFDEGYQFAETMGFQLSETDFHLLTSEDQHKLWQQLPITRLAGPNTANLETPEGVLGAPRDDLDSYRRRSLESLGRFLASL